MSKQEFNLELKAIKYNTFGHGDSHNYQANLYLNGKKVAQVTNDGWGGPDHEQWFDKDAEHAIREHFQMLPEQQAGFEVEGKPCYIKASLEIWCCERVNDWLVLQDAKKTIKKVAYFNPADKGIYTMAAKVKPTPENLARVRECEWWKADYVMLNEQPIEKVVEYLRSAA